MKETPNILIVDDTPANLTVLGTMLTAQGFKVRPAINGQVALTAARATLPDLILLDINMPGMNGYEVCQQLKNDPKTADVPIIFISALDEIQDKVRAFQVGGVDYITKPFHVEEVNARVRAHLAIEFQRREIQALNTFKDELLRIVSHDLKNPINVFLGYTDMLLEEYPEGYTHDILGKMRRSSQKMWLLVSDLLDVARAEDEVSFDIRPVNLHPLLRQCIEEQELGAEQKAIHIQFEPDAHDTTVYVDKNRFGQVMSNLLSNAIKYTPDGGTVTVSTQLDTDSVQINVIDTGLGIPAESIPHLFEKFYRVPGSAHMAREGTGLGLAIVKTITQRMNGTIGVESELGKGSRFWVSLPCQ